MVSIGNTQAACFFKESYHFLYIKEHWKNFNGLGINLIQHWSVGTGNLMAYFLSFKQNPLPSKSPRVVSSWFIFLKLKAFCA